VAPLFVSREFLESYEPPPLPASAKCFTVGYSQARELPDGETYCSWLEDRTRATDSPAVAIAWALMLAGLADDGENSHPLARVTGFSVDPTDRLEDDEGLLPGEQTVFYVGVDGEVLSPGVGAFSEFENLTAEWSEIVKIAALEAAAVGS
jgi:hypothetical protein